MFKDYDKYLSTSLKIYTFLLVIIFIMKIVGLDYFGLDVNNPIMISINEFCLKWKLEYLYVFFLCYLTSYIIVSLTINNNTKKLKSFMLLIFPITILIKYSGYYANYFIYLVLQILYLLIISFVYSKKINKEIIIRYIKYNVIFLILQCISIIFRNQTFNYKEYNLIVAILLDLDYVLLMLILHKLNFMEGGKICYHYQVEEVGLFSLKKINLSTLLKRLQRNLHNFKQLDKETKLTYIIYFFLSSIWNILTIIIVLLVARLNDTFIECLFILTSFWLSKRVFGKPFHLPSMKQCFIVSNLTYYILNRITAPLGISILIPVMLGVGLSYVTSKLVKKTYKPLYKGMPNDLFETTIIKVTDKDSLEYKICYEYFVKNKSALQVSNKYNYSYDGVKKIFKRINDKIKGL
jgi:hypothetical protein